MDILIKKITIFIILIFPWNTSIWSQDYIVNSQFYGIEEGLSHRNVQCIHQDQEGFMWFGTKYGLNRFDGSHFKWYTKEKQGLQFNEINHILQDNQGLMWLFQTGGHKDYHVKYIDLFDPETQAVQSFEEKFGKTAVFTPHEVVNFTKNEAGHLVFITRQNQLITYLNQFEVFPLDFESFEKVEKIHWAPNGTFWVIVKEKSELGNEANHTIYILDERGGTSSIYRHYPSSYLYVYDFDEADNGRYIVSHHVRKEGFRSSEFFLIDVNGNRLKDSFSQQYFKNHEVDFSKINGISLIKANNDDYWIYSGDLKFNVLDSKSGRTHLLSSQHPYLEATTDVYFDARGVTWLSTQFGIYSFVKQKNKFRKYLYQQKEKGRSANFACRGMTRDEQNQLWVMVENGDESIWKVNLNTGEEKPLPSVINEEFANLRLDGTKYAITSGKDGDLYFAINCCLLGFDPETDQYRSYRFNTEGRRTSVWTLKEDKYSKIWFATQYNPGDLGYFEGSKVRLISNWEGSGKRLYVYQILETDSDTAWLASDEGLFTINVKTGESLKHYWRKGKEMFHLPFDNVHHIHKDSDSSFWLATAGNGLVQWSPQKGIIQQFTRADGLPNNTLYAIYEDKEENFWMSSDYGIIKFNKRTHQVKSYVKKDGISQNEFNRISHYQDKAGNIYFGGLNGVTAFHPKDFYANSLSENPSLVITEFQQFDGVQNILMDKTSELKQNKTITIKPNDRFFRLGFALLTYEEVDKIQYALKVEGVDVDWSYQKENSIRLSRLPYGTHTLRIKGQAPDGHWSEHELAIKVSVLKPFYLETGFILICVLIFLTIGPVFHKWRTSMLKKKQKELEYIVSERTKELVEDKKIIENQNLTLEQQAEELKSLEDLKSRFFANVSHELRTPLTLILGPVKTMIKDAEIKAKNRQLLKFIHRNSNQLLKLINEILDLSKLETGKLEVKEEVVHLNNFLKAILSQFHSYARSVEVELSVMYPADQELQLWLDKDKMEKIIQNYLSNAMKFTPINGKVVVRVNETDDHILLSVEDNGKGIHPDDLPHIFDRFYQSKRPDMKTKGGTGIGLSLCHELAELINGKVWAESEFGKGSVFYFEFPKKVVKGSQLSDVRLNQEKLEKLKFQKPQEELVENLTQKPTTTDNRQLTTDNKQPKTTILLVEDNSDLREFIKIVLPEYNILTAENGKSALDLLHSQPTTENRQPTTDNQQPKTDTPQLIISDLMMPVMDGFEFLEKVKLDDRWRHIPVIMLTAKVNVKAKLNALRIGVDDYLTKPFEEEELRARIKNLLKNHRQRMELFAKNVNDLSQIPKESQPVIAKVDAQWLEEVEAVFTKHLSEGDFKIGLAAHHLNISTSQFQKRIKRITGLAAHQYLLEMRLQKTKEYLTTGEFATVKEVGYAVGFRNTKYFSGLFKKRFGVVPSGYLKQ